MNLKLYEKTIIRLEIILSFYIIGAILFIIFYNKLKKISIWNNFNNLIFCISVVGNLLSSSLLGLNYYFAENNSKIIEFKIQEKKEAVGPKYNRSKKSPIIIIQVENSYTKEIKFSRKQYEKWKTAKFVELELSKGLFNFPVIRNKSLK